MASVQDNRPGVPVPGPQRPGGGPVGATRSNWLADLWHHHPWLVGGAVGAAGVGAFVFYEKNIAHKSTSSSTGSGGGGRGRGGDHVVTDHISQGGGGRGRHDARQHHQAIFGGGADSQDSGDLAGPDDAALMNQMGTLQDAITDYTLARARNVTPGGPNPGPQVTPTGSTDVPPNPAAIPMP